MARKAHNKQNLVGKKFGDLTVIAEAGRTAAQKTTWLCRCNCGKEHIAVGGSLVSGHTTSCGCGRFTRPRNLKHGHTSDFGQRLVSRAYVAWYQMKQRCDNPNSKQFKDYGGRGITYDPKWKDFVHFFADMGDSPAGYSLDRKNNALGYFQGNCRWATATQQCRNQRSNIPITFNGKTRILSEWAELLGLNYNTLYQRIVVRKWPLEKALTRKQYDRRGRLKE